MNQTDYRWDFIVNYGVPLVIVIVMTQSTLIMFEKLTENDVIPFKEFELKWRFTDDKYNQLPDEDLSLIFPIAKKRADEYSKNSLRYLDNACLLKSEFGEIDSFKISNDYEEVISWLNAKQIDPETKIIISWDESNCVMTYWSIFCKYWDDFCYPSSDDILIWPSSVDWILYYGHHEILEYGVLKS